MKKIGIGDKVKLITKSQAVGQETNNWIEYEKSNPKIGKKFIVEDVHYESSGCWLFIKGLLYTHPASKFELI